MPIVNSYQAAPTAVADFAEEIGYLQERGKQIAEQRAIAQRKAEIEARWRHDDSTMSERLQAQMELARKQHEWQTEAAAVAYKRNLAKTALAARMSNDYRSQIIAQEFDGQLRMAKRQERIAKETKGWSYSPAQERTRRELELQMDNIRKTDILTDQEKQQKIQELRGQIEEAIPEVPPEKAQYRPGDIFKIDDVEYMQMPDGSRKPSPKQEHIWSLEKEKLMANKKARIAEVHAKAKMEAERQRAEAEARKIKQEQYKNVVDTYSREAARLYREVAPTGSLTNSVKKARYEVEKRQRDLTLARQEARRLANVYNSMATDPDIDEKTKEAAKAKLDQAMNKAESVKAALDAATNMLTPLQQERTKRIARLNAFLAKKAAYTAAHAESEDMKALALDELRRLASGGNGEAAKELKRLAVQRILERKRQEQQSVNASEASMSQG